MLKVFAVIAVVSFAIVLLLALAARSTLARWAVFLLLLAAVVLGLGPYRVRVDRWLFREIGGRVAEVSSGNEFSLRGELFLHRKMILAGTRLPEDPSAAARSRQALQDLIGGRDVRVEFVRTNGDDVEPWEVCATVGGKDVITTQMVAGHLTNAPQAPGTGTSLAGAVPLSAGRDDIPVVATEGREQTGRWPVMLRYLVWIVLGFLGGSFLGVALGGNRLLRGMAILAIGIVGAMVYAAVTSVQQGESVIPPAVGLLLLAANTAIARKYTTPRVKELEAEIRRQQRQGRR